MLAIEVEHAGGVRQYNWCLPLARDQELRKNDRRWQGLELGSDMMVYEDIDGNVHGNGDVCE